MKKDNAKLNLQELYNSITKIENKDEVIKDLTSNLQNANIDDFLDLLITESPNNIVVRIAASSLNEMIIADDLLVGLRSFKNAFCELPSVKGRGGSILV